jgi:hypothetical protein
MFCIRFVREVWHSYSSEDVGVDLPVVTSLAPVTMIVIVLSAHITKKYYFSFYTTCFGLIDHSQVFYKV